MDISQDPNIPNFTTNTDIEKSYLPKKKKKNVNGLAEIRETREPNFRVLSPENGVDIGCSPNLGRYACTSQYTQCEDISDTHAA